MEQELVNVAVVLGSGRSGTSLTMNLASKIGVQISSELVGPSSNNKKGAYEDRRILEINRSVLRRFQRNGSFFSYLPMPEGWLEDDKVKEAEIMLSSIVLDETLDGRFWGFKEPTTAKLLPMWKRIFPRCCVNPIYLLSLRHPSGVIKSFEKAYGTPREITTLVWLSRYVDAVVNTGVEFAIFDYDDWFLCPSDNIKRLAVALGIDFFSVEDAAVEIDASIKSVVGECEVDEVALKLYSALYNFKDGLCGKTDVLNAARCAQDKLESYSFISFTVDALGDKLNAVRDRLNKTCRELDKSRGLASRLREKNKKILFDSRLESVVTEDNCSKTVCKHFDLTKYILHKRKIPVYSGCKIIAGVASFKAREQIFKESIDSVYSQFDHIYVYLNGYDCTPDFLNKDKITVFHSNNFADLSANGKVFPLGDVGSCYFFTIDDDILYPVDYVSRMINCLNKYDNKVGVCVHGSILPDYPLWYYERYTLYPFQGELENDKFVNLVGSGTFAFHTDVLKADFEDFMPDVMVDLKFSILAKQQGIPLVSIARKKFWLKALLKGEGLYQDFLFKQTIHTKKVIEHSPWGFDLYASIIKNKIGAKILGLPHVDLVANEFDVDFINSVNSGVAPNNWSETELYRIKVEDREFLKNPIRMYRSALNKISWFQRREVVNKKKLNKLNMKIGDLKSQNVRLRESNIAMKRRLKNIYNSKTYKVAETLASSIKHPLWSIPLLSCKLMKILFKRQKQ